MLSESPGLAGRDARARATFHGQLKKICSSSTLVCGFSASLSLDTIQAPGRDVASYVSTSETPDRSNLALLAIGFEDRFRHGGFVRSHAAAEPFGIRALPLPGAAGDERIAA